jgi:hypothetical protein
LSCHGLSSFLRSPSRRRAVSFDIAYAPACLYGHVILARLADLLPLIADDLYHPEFRGSFSIKQVLPALVPDLSYQELVIRDGDTAITRFARMARGEILADDISLTRLQLLHYCKLDTLSMVRLHETLLNIASA